MAMRWRTTRRLAASQLEPVALDVRVLSVNRTHEPQRLLAGTVRDQPRGTASQVAEAQRELIGAPSQCSMDQAEGGWWAEQVRRPWALARQHVSD